MAKIETRDQKMSRSFSLDFLKEQRFQIFIISSKYNQINNEGSKIKGHDIFSNLLCLFLTKFLTSIYQFNQQTFLISRYLFCMKIYILTIVFFLLSSLCKKVFYEQMHDSTYIVAVPSHLTRHRQKLQHELSKYFHLPQQPKEAHDYINYDSYTRNEQQLNINNSPDKSILLKLKNLCYGGKDVTYLSNQEKLKEFKKGKCSPVVILPGILATSLLIQIDCEKLKAFQNGRIFKSCGWSSCSRFGLNTPDPEYLLWVGLDLTLKVTGGYTKCFGDLFGLLYDKNSDSQNFGSRYSFPAGIKSTWFGNTETSKATNKCGSNSIRDLNGYVSILSVMGSQCALKDYGRMLDMLYAMGYTPGLTLQAVPYDFRYGILASSTPKFFPQAINNLYYITGKKVVIVAHSLGTLHTLMGLAYFISAQMKEKMIRHYIPITPPWFGTVSAMRNTMYGDTSYFTSGMFPTGINKYAQMKFSAVSGSTYDLFLRDAFKTYRNQPWMQQVLKRIAYQKEGRTKKIEYNQNEDLENGQQDYPLNWFPSKYQKCFDDFFKENPYCETGFIDFVETPIFQIKGKKYYGTDQSITELLQDSLSQDMFETALSLWKQTKIAGKSLNQIPSPGVNTSMIFTTAYKTEIFYKYNDYAKEDKFDENTFFKAVQTNYTPGDISVPSFSALLFVSKWIHEQSNGGHEVNVIQYCGNYKGKKKHYSTITCQCNRNPFKNQLDCTHPCIISDKHLIAFVMGVLTNSMKGYEQNLSEAIALSERQISNHINRCLNLHPNGKIYPK